MNTRKKTNRKALAIIVLILFSFITGITALIVHSKTNIANNSIEKLRKKGAIIESDGEFYSRGFFSDLAYSVTTFFAYESNLGHKAYSVKLNDDFQDIDLIQVNAIPHVAVLHLDSKQMSNAIFGNLHASDLLIELKLSRVQCDANGLKHLVKFKNLQTLSLVSLENIHKDDYDFVNKITLKHLNLRHMEVDPIAFADDFKLPAPTILSIEMPQRAKSLK